MYQDTDEIMNILLLYEEIPHFLAKDKSDKGISFFFQITENVE